MIREGFMGIAQIGVLLGAVVLSVLVVWYFFFSEKKGTQLVASGGVQEATIVVKGGYTPDVLVVKAGQPVRLNFNRQETASCSEMVLFPDFDKSARLPTGETVPIEFTPDKPGEYDFQCQMGMLHGKLIVE
jgi:plastocyanin domain-containing protein